jgi:hypothetical protein
MIPNEKSSRLKKITLQKSSVVDPEIWSNRHHFEGPHPFQPKSKRKLYFFPENIKIENTAKNIDYYDTYDADEIDKTM